MIAPAVARPKGCGGRLMTAEAGCAGPNAKRQTPNDKRQTPKGEAERKIIGGGWAVCVGRCGEERGARSRWRDRGNGCTGCVPRVRAGYSLRFGSGARQRRIS